MTTNVFVVFDPSDRAYPILGIHTSLAKAEEVCREDPGSFCIYEEAMDQNYDDPKHPPFETVHHDVGGTCPCTQKGSP